MNIPFKPAALWLMGLALLACGGDRARQPDASKLSWTHFESSEAPEMTPELIALGKRLYFENCAACHGPEGAGDGICSPFLAQKPRDFTRGIYRFKQSQSGDLPSDGDLFRTISVGLQGTAMPPWMYLLSETERWALVGYIKTFSRFFESEASGDPLDLGPEPDHITDQQVKRGKEVFERVGCVRCHGPRGFGDGPSALGMMDSFGNPIRPRNFHRAVEFKRGHTMADIALTISTGNDGTPMPSFRDGLSSEEVWELAAFVHSLADPRFSTAGTPAAAHSGTDLGEPDVVVKIMERNWKYLPEQVTVRQGQLVRIEFQPTDNGLGAGHGLAIDGYDQVAFINGAMVQRPKSLTFRADKPGTFTFYCATQCSTENLHPRMKGTLIVEPAI